ncbi:MAG: hypothetical protein ACI934_001148, partial [Pseudohongiellaceae bacterium]
RPMPYMMSEVSKAFNMAGYSIESDLDSSIILRRGDTEYRMTFGFNRYPNEEKDNIQKNPVIKPSDNGSGFLEIQYRDGTRETLYPYFTSALYTYLEEHDVIYNYDRATGVISIDGMDYMPGYETRRMRLHESVFWGHNRDWTDIALEYEDVNGDGLEDILIYRYRGIQTLYGLGSGI